MNVDELITTLQNAGFAPYQAQAYVALLELGSASAQEIATASDVPGPRIYDVLHSLEEDGYITTYEQDQLYARADDPSEALDGLRSHITTLEAAIDEVETQWHQPNLEDHEATIVKHFDTVRKRARTNIDDAEHVVQVAVTPDQFEDFQSELQAAHERDVYVQVSLYAPSDDDLPIEPDRFEGVCTEVRRREIPEPFLAITDRRRVAYAPYVPSPREYGVLVDDRMLTFVFHWMFLTSLWEVYETIYVDRDDSLPLVFVEMRECIQMIEPLLANGATIEARIEGYSVRSGREQELRGMITDIRYIDESFDEDSVTLLQLAAQAAIVLETDNQAYLVGGEGAIVEDIGADRVVIEAIDKKS